MLEKLALALLNDDRMAAGFPPVESREHIPDSDGYVRNARAVLTALREPTPEMVEAARKGAVLDPKLSAMWGRGLLANWQAMIDKAMEQ